jgi:pilus assembly protein CpaE
MSNLRTISFRIPAEKVAELDKIAKAKDRDRSYLLNEAVANYVSEQRHPAALAEKNLGAPLKKELAKNAHTGTSFGPRKLGKTATKEIVHPVEDRSKPSSGPTRESAYDFLAPLETQGTISETQARGEAHSETDFPEAKLGRVLVFLSAKGGSGVTTLACNFAVSLARESKKRTLLIDLNLPLGDAAINLGIQPQYSVVSAFQNFSRLDASFLSTLLVKHASGLFVLAAPSELGRTYVSVEAIEKLLTIARQEFDYVVVDAGSKLDMKYTHSFDESTTIYLVTQIGVPELRNSNRLIAQFPRIGGPTVEVVINRFDPDNQGIDEAHITKALTRPARWRVPNDYAAAQRMQNAPKRIMHENSPILEAIQQMVGGVSGRPDVVDEKKSINFFGWKISRN